MKNTRQQAPVHDLVEKLFASSFYPMTQELPEVHESQSEGARPCYECGTHARYECCYPGCDRWMCQSHTITIIDQQTQEKRHYCSHCMLTLGLMNYQDRENDDEDGEDTEHQPAY